VLAISRYFVEASRRDEFETAYKAGVSYLADNTAPFSYCGAWRIDKEGQDDEFVLFSGWNEVQDHFAFAGSKEFEEFGKIKEFSKGAEIKHVRLQKWE
jgi:heme-degrading monooxygenase HmoA